MFFGMAWTEERKYVCVLKIYEDVCIRERGGGGVLDPGELVALCMGGAKKGTDHLEQVIWASVTGVCSEVRIPKSSVFFVLICTETEEHV